MSDPFQPRTLYGATDIPPLESARDRIQALDAENKRLREELESQWLRAFPHTDSLDPGGGTMSEHRLPPALREKAHTALAPRVEYVSLDDLRDWLYGGEGMVPSTWTPDDPEPEPTPDLVERVQRRAAALFAAWKDQGIEDVSLAWGLALRAELGEEP